MTKRPCSPGLEALLFECQSVSALDDIAFVTPLDYMGTDACIAEAARVSYGVTTKTQSDNTGLIRRLMRDAHTSPFEMAEVKFHIKLPIFVARQWIRHRTANVNEFSARFKGVVNEFWIPRLEDMRVQSEINHQCSDGPMQGDPAVIHDAFTRVSEEAFGAYTMALAHGMAREQARSVLPVSTYTQWFWKCDLHNLLHFLDLRCADDAQPEIAAYAWKICEVVKAWCPLTFAAWLDYRKHAPRLSLPAWRVLWKHLSDARGIETDLAAAGVSKSETAAVMRLVRDEPV